MRNVIALLCGLVFGVGLAVSGMTDTAKVLGFLDVLGNWTPDLAFVIGAAACVILITFPFVMRRKSPLMSLRFLLPNNEVHQRATRRWCCPLWYRLGTVWLFPRLGDVIVTLPGLENRNIRCGHADWHGTGKQGFSQLILGPLATPKL